MYLIISLTIFYTMNASEGCILDCVPVKLSFGERSFGRRELDSFRGLLSAQLYYIGFTFI